MTREYKTNSCIYTCGVCTYFHEESYDGKDYGTEPFIELCEPVLFEKNYMIRRLTQYVCPNCGTVQVNVNDL